MLKLHPLLILLLCSRCLAADAPAHPADAWLDRAARDIAALPAQPVPEQIFLAPYSMVTQLYFTAPSDARRALAVRLVEREIKAEVDKHQSAEQTQTAYLAGAGILPIRGRVRLDYVLAVTEIQAGQQQDLLNRLPSIASPNERALIELAAAQALSHKEYQGDYHEWRPREVRCSD